MNKKVACCLSGAVGAICGGIGVYYHMKKKIDILRNEMDGRIAVEVERFKKKYKTQLDADSGDSSQVEEKQDEPVRSKSYIMKTSLDGGPAVRSKIDYHKMSAVYRKSEADLAAMEAPEEDDILEEDGQFKLITVEEYEDDDGYDKHEFIWYLEDDALVDEYDEEIDEREKISGRLLGSEMRDSLFDEPDGTLTLYVRNETAKSDFSIEIERDISYEEARAQK